MFEDKIKKYNEEWNLFFEKHHDLELENLVNNSKINIFIYENSLYEKSNFDFEHTYIDDGYDSWYSCRSSLRHLFENGFRWINIAKDSKYYQLLIDFDTELCRTPYKDFQNKNDFFVLKSPENKIYCILGVGFMPKNINKTFFGYLGELYKKTSKQTTIFDFIDEE